MEIDVSTSIDETSRLTYTNCIMMFALTGTHGFAVIPPVILDVVVSTCWKTGTGEGGCNP